MKVKIFYLICFPVLVLMYPVNAVLTQNVDVKKEHELSSSHKNTASRKAKKQQEKAEKLREKKEAKHKKEQQKQKEQEEKALRKKNKKEEKSKIAKKKGDAVKDKDSSSQNGSSADGSLIVAGGKKAEVGRKQNIGAEQRRYVSIEKNNKYKETPLQSNKISNRKAEEGGYAVLQRTHGETGATFGDVVVGVSMEESDKGKKDRRSRKAPVLDSRSSAIEKRYRKARRRGKPAVHKATFGYHPTDVKKRVRKLEVYGAINGMVGYGQVNLSELSLQIDSSFRFGSVAYGIGGSIGFQFMLNKIYLAIEGGFNGMYGNFGAAAFDYYPPTNEYMGDIRMKFGVGFGRDNALRSYFILGLSFMSLSVKNDDGSSSGRVNFAFGLDLGVGIRYAINRHIDVFLEIISNMGARAAVADIHSKSDAAANYLQLPLYLSTGVALRF